MESCVNRHVIAHFMRSVEKGTRSIINQMVIFSFFSVYVGVSFSFTLAECVFDLMSAHLQIRANIFVCACACVCGCVEKLLNFKQKTYANLFSPFHGQFICCQQNIISGLFQWVERQCLFIYSIILVSSVEQKILN